MHTSQAHRLLVTGPLACACLGTESRVPLVEPDKHYRAFISYSQQDAIWGKRLQGWLETYQLPAGIRAGESGSRRLGRFFRDDADMAAAADIAVQVRNAIANSDGLIVICSPHSAQSKWVDAEILQFRRTGRGHGVFAFIIDGVPNSGDRQTECFPPALRAAGDPQDPSALPIEPLGLDVRKDGRAKACARLAAGLLGVDFDDLWRRDQRRAKNRQRRLVAGLAALSLVFAVLAGFAVSFGVQAHDTLMRFFATRGDEQISLRGDDILAAKYALAGLKLSPGNAR